MAGLLLAALVRTRRRRRSVSGPVARAVRLKAGGPPRPLTPRALLLSPRRVIRTIHKGCVASKIRSGMPAADPVARRSWRLPVVPACAPRC
eukprot:9265154-Alexandrium_andersonii.AAC.1